jgi:hypothetical protein
MGVPVSGCSTWHSWKDEEMKKCEDYKGIVAKY